MAHLFLKTNEMEKLSEGKLVEIPKKCCKKERL